jgi:transposase-like protein
MDDMVFCEALHDRDGHSTAPPTGAASEGGHAMKQHALELISTVLSTAQKAEIVGAKVQIDGTLTLDIEIDGEHALTLSIDEMRVVRGDFDELANRPTNLRGRYNRVKNASELSVEELRARNLPLYWNEQWLKRALDEHKTYAAVARTYGFPSATTIASYAKRNFGFDIQGDFDRRRTELVQKYLAAEHTDDPITHIQLAKDHDVAVATVYRWIKEHKEGKTPNPDRVNRRKSAGKSTATGEEAVGATAEAPAAPRKAAITRSGTRRGRRSS